MKSIGRVSWKVPPAVQQRWYPHYHVTIQHVNPVSRNISTLLHQNFAIYILFCNVKANIPEFKHILDTRSAFQYKYDYYNIKITLFCKVHMYWKYLTCNPHSITVQPEVYLTKKFRVFRDVAPCSLVEVDRRFRGDSSPWWWRQYVPLKRRTTLRLHGTCLRYG
jgi:hypothetical protein